MLRYREDTFNCYLRAKSAKKENLGVANALVSASCCDHWSAAINFFCRISFRWMPRKLFCRLSNCTPIYNFNLTILKLILYWESWNSVYLKIMEFIFKKWIIKCIFNIAFQNLFIFFDIIGRNNWISCKQL